MHTKYEQTIPHGHAINAYQYEQTIPHCHAINAYQYEQTIPHCHGLNAYQIYTNYTTLSRFKCIPNMNKLYHMVTL